MVRCYPTKWFMYVDWGTGLKYRFDTPPTAGSFTKVPSKPTNHSKYTTKSPLHYILNPPDKSKHKVKGSHKLTCTDHQHFSGVPALKALRDLTGDYYDYDYENDFYDKYDDDRFYRYCCSMCDGCYGKKDEEEEQQGVASYGYSFADLFRGDEGHMEMGSFSEWDWVRDDEPFISDVMELEMLEEDYQIVYDDDDVEDYDVVDDAYNGQDGGWSFVYKHWY